MGCDEIEHVECNNQLLETLHRDGPVEAEDVA